MCFISCLPSSIVLVSRKKEEADSAVHNMYTSIQFIPDSGGSV